MLRVVSTIVSMVHMKRRNQNMPEGLEDPVKSNLLPVLPEDVPLTVALIFGTRPEAIKMAPLIRRLGHHPARFKPITIVTAQHRSMLDQVLELFSISPDFDLNVIQPRQSLAKIVARAVPELDSILKRIKPHFVIVQGDTSTTFIGALAAFYNHFPVAHVEAGLRTHKKYYPFPEEINRHLTSVLSDIHFAPTIESKQNLINEGISPGKIWITGNTVIDALQDILSWGENCAHPVLKRIAKNQCRMVFVTSHRRENQGKPQEQICLALLELVRKFRDMLIVFPVHLSPSVREIIMPALRQQDRVVLLDPIDYFETVHFMKAAHLILTDSGAWRCRSRSLSRAVCRRAA